MKYGLKEETVEKINHVFSHYAQLEKVMLYGSRARGNFKNGSDIDLTFHGENLNLSILSKIDNELDDLLLPYSFDLSIFKHIDNADLIAHIKQVGIVFYEKGQNTFKMTSKVSNAISTHAQTEDPYECCGLLAGKNGIATEIYEITNLPSDDPSIVDLKVPADRTLRYVMDPKQQITAFKKMRENSTELVAIYHSHTHSPAYPSETDIRLAFYPDVHYLIVSLENKNKPQIRAFRIVNEKVSEEEVVLTESSNQ